MASKAQSNFFVAYENDQVAVQAIQILHSRGYNAFSLEEGVSPPREAVFIFSCRGQFSSKFLATIPEHFAKRGMVPPDAAAGALQYLPVRRTADGAPYGKRADNFAAALENFVGYVRPKRERAKIDRRALSRQRRREDRYASFY